MLNDKAVELGRLIGQSAEYQALKRANEALNDDREVVTALQRMDALRTEAQTMIERGEQPTPQMEQELDVLLTKVQGSTIYQRVIAANENFDKVMRQVNDWILEGIKKGAASSIITLG
ncbi:MAG: YlbF family regulator [Gemmatimonadaceae bacterium]|nr:YlbF family regulator [Gemmatimonadaceae bacterium]